MFWQGRLISLLPLLLLGCGHGGSQAAQVSPQELIACPLEGVGTRTQPWRLIHGSGFSFCLPPGWRVARGANSWTGPEGTIAWGRGGQPVDIETQAPVMRGEMVQRVPASELPRILSELQAPCPPPVPESAIVGGRAVLLRKSSCRGAYSTSASWREAALLFAGAAAGPLGAEIQLTIYRTVRFDDVP